MKLSITLALAIGIGISFCNASASTYYVDAASGNDAWSGTRDAPAGSPAIDGPWQSISRVSQAALLPGDSVRLKCGQSWNETLMIGVSGTPAAPITVTSQPLGCTDKPLIDGSIAVPSHAWTYFADDIYKVSIPFNLILNGQFDSGLAGWTKWSATGDSVLAPDEQCDSSASPCLLVTSGTGAGNSIATSRSFPIVGGKTYSVSFKIKAPIATSILVGIRRNGVPYDSGGLMTRVQGTGAWQPHLFTFQAKATMPNARLDFEVPPGRVSIGLDDVRVLAYPVSPAQVLVDGMPINPAHHPNRGFNAGKPESLYLTIPSDSDRLPFGTLTRSSYLNTGNDLELPRGASLSAGVKVRIRSTPWRLEERTIASVEGGRLILDDPTNYPISTGFGYFLMGALWMLDEPGEWYYDPKERALFVRMPDSGVPSNRISIGATMPGIDLTGRSNIVLDGLAVHGASVGVIVRSTANVTIRNFSIVNSATVGVDALSSTNTTIDANSITTSGADAVSAVDYFGRYATDLRVVNNRIFGSAVRIVSGRPVNLPTPSFAAISPGVRALVSENSISGAAYIGIAPFQSSTVSNNYIEGSCYLLDDCGAIYLHGAGNNGLISGNIIRGAFGTDDGRPESTYSSHAVGIYLDDQSSGITVSGNTVAEADYGIQLHNASNNSIVGNTLYANRRFQLWLQENANVVRAAGDVYGNRIEGNRFVPTIVESAVRHSTIFLTTASFANYDRNQYSALLYPKIGSEFWNGGWEYFTLNDWQAAQANGVSRGLDPNGSQVAPVGYTSFRTAGGSLISNGTFANGFTGWSSWNQTAPTGQLSLDTCSVGKCLRYTAGGSSGLVSSPNFSVIQGAWYRVSFDIKTGASNQGLSVLILRGGGGSNNYESLMKAPEAVTGDTTWRRVSFVFQATKTVNRNDPLTLDKGARLDFMLIQPGQTVSVANIELVPVSAVDAGISTRILLNPSPSAAALGCPDANMNAALCTQYVNFRDGTPVSWPHIVPGHGSEIIFTRDSTLVDTDSDGIPDSQDNCAFSAVGTAVNSLGCSLQQTFPGV